MESLIYTLLLLALAAFSFLLGLHIMLKNPYHRPGQAFFILMIIIAIRCLLTTYFLHSTEPEAALMRGKAVMAATVLFYGSTCYLASFLPYSRYRGGLARYSAHYWAGIAILATVSAIALDSVVDTPWGYMIEKAPSALVGYGTSLALATLASFIAVTARQGSKDASFRSNVLLLAAAPFLPFVAAAPFMAFGMPILLSPGLFAAALIYAHLVEKHKIMSIPSSSRSPRTRRAASGGSILMEGIDMRYAYRTFLNDVSAGYSGLIICRRYPDRVRKELSPLDVPMIWLSSQPGQDHVDPTSLNILLHTVTRFIERSAPAVILIEGVECLITQNSVGEVLRTLYSMRDSAIVTGSKLIILLDPEILHEKDLAMMEKEFTVQYATA